MMLTVYHRIQSTFRMAPDGIVHPQEFRKVADVATTDLEQAFMLTNHIECHWWEHAEVTMHCASRSTSVGDVLQDEQGQVWEVAGAGFVRSVWSSSQERGAK